jgi:Tol biopolymer transport system component
MTGPDRKAFPYLDSAARQAQAEFSPDGRFVAYISNESGNNEVYVQPFPNAADGKWMISSGGGVQPHWSRDGKELFYFSGRTLMTMAVTLQPTFAPGTTTRLFDAPVQAGYSNDSDRWQVAADSQRFLLLPASTSSHAPPIDVIVNWESLLTRGRQ